MTSRVSSSHTSSLGRGPLALGFLLLCTSTVQASLQCTKGWKNGEAVLQDIPDEWINDGYCDCPFDGLDEPNTNACSGSKDWPGIHTNKEQAKTPEDTDTSTWFVCPQQPDLKLPPSRIQDGICDCCDGVDEAEAEGTCEDQCEEILRAAREARQKLEADFAKGSAQRSQELEAFVKMKREKLKQIKSWAEEMQGLDPEVFNTKMEELQQTYLTQRTQTIESIVKTSSSLLEGLGKEELQALLPHLCQLAGEMDVFSDDDKICTPLRLAGLDIGLTWGDDDFEQVESMNVANADEKDLAAMLFENAAEEKRGWKLDAARRRLEEDWTDDEVYDDDEYRGYHDDIYDGYNDYDDDDYKGRDTSKTSKITPSQLELTGAAKEAFDTILELPFSQTRKSFLAKSKELVDEISKKMMAAPAKTDDSKNETEEDEAGEEPEGANEEKPMDTAAYIMLQSNLKKMDASIQKGARWASSAQLFVTANPDLSEEQLQKLILLTIYHGKLSSLSIWQTLQSTLDELGGPPVQEEDETCASPWAGSCPPKTIKRGKTTIPSADLVVAAETFCSGQTQVMEAVCAVKGDDIPASIPDGYYGYSAPVQRDDQDPMTSAWSPLADLAANKAGLEQLEENKRKMEKQKKALETKMTQAWKDIGGKKGDKMGPKGELYALSNKCFSVEAGKYIYEVCLFGDAKQKEGPKDRGTSLGKFKRMEVDEETGERVMYWENGAKCWNGPHRSATVHVTCGAETKVLSADEPDTCRYVLQMESHIACDDKYKERMGL